MVPKNTPVNSIFNTVMEVVENDNPTMPDSPNTVYYSFAKNTPKDDDYYRTHVEPLLEQNGDCLSKETISIFSSACLAMTPSSLKGRGYMRDMFSTLLIQPTLSYQQVFMLIAEAVRLFPQSEYCTLLMEKNNHFFLGYKSDTNYPVIKYVNHKGVHEIVFLSNSDFCITYPTDYYDTNILIDALKFFYIVRVAQGTHESFNKKQYLTLWEENYHELVHGKPCAFSPEVLCRWKLLFVPADPKNTSVNLYQLRDTIALSRHPAMFNPEVLLVNILRARDGGNDPYYLKVILITDIVKHCMKVTQKPLKLTDGSVTVCFTVTEDDALIIDYRDLFLTTTVNLTETISASYEQGCVSILDHALNVLRCNLLGQ